MAERASAPEGPATRYEPRTTDHPPPATDHSPPITHPPPAADHPPQSGSSRRCRATGASGAGRGPLWRSSPSLTGRWSGLRVWAMCSFTRTAAEEVTIFFTLNFCVTFVTFAPSWQSPHPPAHLPTCPPAYSARSAHVFAHRPVRSLLPPDAPWHLYYSASSVHLPDSNVDEPIYQGSASSRSLRGPWTRDSDKPLPVAKGSLPDTMEILGVGSIKLVPPQLVDQLGA